MLPSNGMDLSKSSLRDFVIDRVGRTRDLNRNDVRYRPLSGGLAYQGRTAAVRPNFSSIAILVCLLVLLSIPLIIHKEDLYKKTRKVIVYLSCIKKFSLLPCIITRQKVHR